MTSTLAIVRRILAQFALDKRTLALLFVAPLVVLWLLSAILGADTVGPKIATVALPSEFQAQLEQTDARISEVTASEVDALLADAEVAAGPLHGRRPHAESRARRRPTRRSRPPC